MTNDTKKTVIYAGPSTLSLLLILFVALKLTGHIDWSWVWVVSPAWIPLGIFAVVLALAAIIVGIDSLYQARKRAKRRAAREAGRG